MSARILVVDDDKAICRTLQLHFTDANHEVLVAHSAEDGLDICESTHVDVVILDIRMSGKSGLQALPEFKSKFPSTRVIMITAFDVMESTISAMQGGAHDYIHKPIDLDELTVAVSRALQLGDRSEKGMDFRDEDEKYGFDIMVGHSRKMVEVFKTIGRIASSSATVLITGESGTGKELVARAVHRASGKCDGPFVAVNCAAMVETLLESDLFGHEKGAFTGAVSRQTGKFALADEGTIFLDEISELSLAMQAKLLRVLQEKEFSPLGSKEPQKVDTRVIGATNVNLLEEVEQHRFRDDLYYRLQVVTIHLPPLRERIEDIPDLIQHMLGRINKAMNRNVGRVSHDVIEALQEYDWPGNVRELENVITKAVALSSGDVITRDLLPALPICPRVDNDSNYRDNSATERSLLEVEKIHVTRVLESTNWHKGRACDILGISRPRLRRLIALHEIEPPAHIKPMEND